MVGDTITYTPEGQDIRQVPRRPARWALELLFTIDAIQDNPGIGENDAMRLGGLAADLELRDFDELHSIDNILSYTREES